jgi:hypothetical protein
LPTGATDTPSADRGAQPWRPTAPGLARHSPDALRIEFRSIFAAIEGGGVFRAQPGVFAYFKTLDDAYERFEVVPQDIIDAGAAVLTVAQAFTDRAQDPEAVGLRE